MLPNLEDLLGYKNPRIVARYKKDHPDNQLIAEDALQEVLKYFWLCEKHREDQKANPEDESLDFAPVVHVEMREMDDMWHTFILFTKDYMEFCNQFFGHFIHHNPAEEEAVFEAEKVEIELTRYLSYIYDHLGEDTLVKWFGECLQEDEDNGT